MCVCVCVLLWCYGSKSITSVYSVDVTRRYEFSRHGSDICAKLIIDLSGGIWTSQSAVLSCVCVLIPPCYCAKRLKVTTFFQLASCLNCPPK